MDDGVCKCNGRRNSDANEDDARGCCLDSCSPWFGEGRIETGVPLFMSQIMILWSSVFFEIVCFVLWRVLFLDLAPVIGSLKRGQRAACNGSTDFLCPKGEERRFLQLPLEKCGSSGEG